MKLSLRTLQVFFTLYAIIMVLAGSVSSFLGFSFFPDRILPPENLLSWVSSIYGSVLIGWGITLILLARHAFRRKDSGLMKLILIGLVAAMRDCRGTANFEV